MRKLAEPPKFPTCRFMPVLGILIGLAAGQVAMADTEEAAATQDAPISTPATAGTHDGTPEPAHAPITTPEDVISGLTGPQVYNAVCIACHAPPGVGSAPGLGDGEAWAARIDQGMETLIDHALNGFSSSTGIMPRKGGRVDLSDEEIIRAVQYMVGQVAQ